MIKYNKMLSKRTEASIYDKYCNISFIHYMIGYAIINWLISLQHIAKINHIYLFLGSAASFITVDALSYFIHMFIDSDFYDRYLTKHNKVTIIDVHHKFPLNYSYLSDTELVSICYPILIPFLLTSFILECYKWDCVNHSAYIGFKMVFLLYCYFGAFAHKWVHERMCNMKLNYIVKWCQDMRLILHPKQHVKHHHTFDCQYSLLNGSFQLIEDIYIKYISLYK